MQIDEEQNHRWLILIVSLFVEIVMSFVLCVIVMRTLVGVVTLPDSVFGLSRPNFKLALLAATIVATVSCCASILIFVVTRPSRQWASIVPAGVIPILGVIGFCFFLIAGIG